MGRLAQYLGPVPGYFRTGDDVAFWASRDSHNWLALLVVEDGKIEPYGFTSAKSNKAQLLNALNAIRGSEAMLLGIWTGSHRTDLFVLDLEKACEVLKSEL